MTQLKTLSEDRKTLILESIELVSALFLGPDRQLCQALKDGDLDDYFPALAEFLGKDSGIFIGCIQGEVKHDEDAERFYQRLNSLYVNLFVNSRDGLDIPLYQSCYSPEGTRLMGPEAQQMRERFESKGLSLSDNHNEPADHLSIELEYLYYLLKKGWESDNELLLEEAAEFSADTLQPWTGQLAVRLRANRDATFHAAFIDILNRLLARISA